MLYCLSYEECACSSVYTLPHPLSARALCNMLQYSIALTFRWNHSLLLQHKNGMWLESVRVRASLSPAA